MVSTFGVTFGMFKISVVVALIAIFSRFVANMLMFMDLNKRVYNHVPGSCSAVAGVDFGSADMDFIESMGAILTTSGLHLWTNATEMPKGQDSQHERRGTVFWYNVTGKTSWETRIESKSLNDKTFNPQGISVWSEGKQITVFIVNHRKRWDTIEVFRYKEVGQEKVLKHMKTVKSPLFSNLNDVLAVGANQFYATNFYYFKQPTWRVAEVYSGARLGNVLYFDGRNATAVVKWVQSPTALALDKGKKFLYVSSLVGERILVYKIEPDRNLTYHSDIQLNTSPDQIFVDPYTADLYVACHPSKSRFLYYATTAPDQSQIPSQVVRIRGRPTKQNWQFYQMYANDGATISGSSVAIRHKDTMVIGSLYHRMLVCDIDYPMALF